LQQVVAANPQIADIDHIPVGDQLRFPLPTTPGEARRATAPLPSARSARRRPVTLSPKTVVVQSRSPTPVATQQPLSSPWTDVPLMEDTGGSM
jgi:hypothetical protein